MAFRHLYITNSARINVENEQLKIIQDEIYTVPLCDISTIMLENSHSVLSVTALGELCENGVCMFVCNRKQLPNGIMIPFNSHHKQSKVLYQQLSLSKPFKKRVWQKIVKQKIINESICLDQITKTQDKYMASLIDKVDSGDTKNIESISAAYYFRKLFSENFSRRTENHINAALNYTYALVRAHIARVLVLYGFIPSIGIFHHNELNNFNLADDFLEPYRGIVDIYVLTYIDNDDKDLTSGEKHMLYNIFNLPVQHEMGKFSLTSSVEAMVISFVKAINEEDYNCLSLPSICL